MKRKKLHVPLVVSLSKLKIKMLVSLIPLFVFALTTFTVMSCLNGPDAIQNGMTLMLDTGEHQVVKLLESRYEEHNSKKILSDPYITWSDTVAHAPNTER